MIKKNFVKLKDILNALTHKEINIILSVLVIVAGTWLFIEIAEDVTEGSTRAFDEYVLKSLRNAEDYEQPRFPEWVSSAMRDITGLGGGPVISLFTIAVCGFLILRKQYAAMWIILFATIGGVLISFGFKEIFQRERPTVVLHLMKVSSLSFPSGHSLMSMVVYLTQAVLLARIQESWKVRIYIISAALFLSFIIGISRIYIGVHYPTDVLAGWSLGLTWAAICWLITWYIQQKKGNKLKEI